ncbi:hypothetical protein CYMTET_27456 [Cymbomonas tetramitiformis]|uniref:Uncharacterized protein n=1 Tax=Cymbomonas tetramitiformis TaxID=36881 RepID=A0AAE0KWW8_9CHLO|nr:hypothetical protein CYMTET_27456 [Cymbomonas tetramitiformis]
MVKGLHLFCCAAAPKSRAEADLEPAISDKDLSKALHKLSKHIKKAVSPREEDIVAYTHSPLFSVAPAVGCDGHNAPLPRTESRPKDSATHAKKIFRETSSGVSPVIGDNFQDWLLSYIDVSPSEQDRPVAAPEITQVASSQVSETDESSASAMGKETQTKAVPNAAGCLSPKPSVAFPPLSMERATSSANAVEGSPRREDWDSVGKSSDVDGFPFPDELNGAGGQQGRWSRGLTVPSHSREPPSERGTLQPAPRRQEPARADSNTLPEETHTSVTHNFRTKPRAELEAGQQVNGEAASRCHPVTALGSAQHSLDAGASSPPESPATLHRIHATDEQASISPIRVRLDPPASAQLRPPSAAQAFTSDEPRSLPHKLFTEERPSKSPSSQLRKVPQTFMPASTAGLPNNAPERGRVAVPPLSSSPQSFAAAMAATRTAPPAFSPRKTSVDRLVDELLTMDPDPPVPEHTTPQCPLPSLKSTVSRRWAAPSMIYSDAVPRGRSNSLALDGWTHFVSSAPVSGATAASSSSPAREEPSASPSSQQQPSLEIPAVGARREGDDGGRPPLPPPRLAPRDAVSRTSFEDELRGVSQATTPRNLCMSISESSTPRTAYQGKELEGDPGQRWVHTELDDQLSLPAQHTLSEPDSPRERWLRQSMELLQQQTAEASKIINAAATISMAAQMTPPAKAKESDSVDPKPVLRMRAATLENPAIKEILEVTKSEDGSECEALPLVAAVPVKLARPHGNQGTELAREMPRVQGVHDEGEIPVQLAQEMPRVQAICDKGKIPRVDHRVQLAQEMPRVQGVHDEGEMQRVDDRVELAQEMPHMGLIASPDANETYDEREGDQTWEWVVKTRTEMSILERLQYGSNAPASVVPPPSSQEGTEEGSISYFETPRSERSGSSQGMRRPSLESWGSGRDQVRVGAPSPRVQPRVHVCLRRDSLPGGDPQGGGPHEGEGVHAKLANGSPRGPSYQSPKTHYSDSDSDLGSSSSTPSRQYLSKLGHREQPQQQVRLFVLSFSLHPLVHFLPCLPEFSCTGPADGSSDAA